MGYIRFYAEIWSGDEVTSPVALLDQQLVSAVHYSFVQVYYSPALELDPDFWGLVNTKLSAGGCPSSLGDHTQTVPPHSYYSDDFMA